MQLTVDLTVFCGSGLTALVIFWSSPAPSVLPLIASAAEAVAVGVLAAQFIGYADVPSLLRGRQ
jgi:hypothetical protein